MLDRRRRRTRTGRFWSYAIDDRPWQGPAPPAVVYLFAENRKARHVHEHLTGFSGVLQVDGYAGYRELAKPNRAGGAVTLAYCLAHARRQFFEVYQKSQSSVAAEALQRIGLVYQIEERVRGQTAAERGIVRQSET
ncbi:IS66 family transposase, partial [Novosphingobium sp.]|uniref:IS66 family transposase n=1 Tax=Novosphingobium sp. TaxID=1874826 RepID=UPI002B49BCEA